MRPNHSARSLVLSSGTEIYTQADALSKVAELRQCRFNRFGQLKLAF